MEYKPELIKFLGRHWEICMPMRVCPLCNTNHPVIIARHIKESEILWPEQCPCCSYNYEDEDILLALDLDSKTKDVIKAALVYLTEAFPDEAKKRNGVFVFLEKINLDKYPDLEPVELHQKAEELHQKFLALQQWLSNQEVRFKPN